MLNEHPVGVQSIGRAVALLRLLATPNGAILAEAARTLDLPLSSAHRIATELARHGLIARVARGRFMAGFTLVDLARNLASNDVMTELARPVLRRLAAATDRTAHLAQLDADMVTYVVREAPRNGHLFTREAMQLEAYCSAIGKMLLAMASLEEREAYLAGGSFVALTARTLVNPAALRAHLKAVAATGYSLDDEEVEVGLFCMAVPVRTPAGVAPTALSLAGAVATEDEQQAILAALHQARTDLARAFGLAR